MYPPEYSEVLTFLHQSSLVFTDAVDMTINKTVLMQAPLSSFSFRLSLIYDSNVNIAFNL